ncbi:hypothetical protein IAG25_15840 [Caballeronia sp. EK]|uniref:hypothetical protein n=1 Tax=Caballeronia sp. EK TaxID=2767469 RepID=UPI0016567D2D|nr:hypothetical protein [Caballeronia sp. EK]MBC8638292.1 hypothetical protein [Caballeronia sp. EK]
MSASLPESIVTRLFVRMLSLWGTRFTALWADSDEAEVKRVWAKGLAHTKPDDFTRGLGALFHEPKPPDLPRFLELCRPVPQQFATHALLLRDDRASMTPEGFAQLQRIKGLLMANPAYLPNSPRADGIQWAYKLLDNAAKGHAVNAMQVAFAEDAIRRWHATHHVAEREADDEPIDLPQRIPSPHIYGDREPGSDDEKAAA